MLGIVKVEGWGVCLGFVVVLIRIVVSERVAQRREQGVQIPGEHVNFMEFEVKQRMIDNLSQTVTHLSTITLLDELLKKSIEGLFGCSTTCTKLIVGELRPTPFPALLQYCQTRQNEFHIP